MLNSIFFQNFYTFGLFNLERVKNLKKNDFGFFCLRTIVGKIKLSLICRYWDFTFRSELCCPVLFSKSRK